MELQAGSFHLNGHIIGFRHAQNQKLELHTQQIAPCVSTGRGFHMNVHVIGFSPQNQKLESPYKTPSSILALRFLHLVIDTINW